MRLRHWCCCVVVRTMSCLVWAGRGQWSEHWWEHWWSTSEVLVSVEVILGERYRRPIARQGSVVLLLKRVATLEVLCDEADPTVFSDCCDILRCLWDWGHLWWEGHVLCCMCRLSFVWEEKLCRTNRSCAHVCVFAVVRAVLAVVWAFVLARREESSTGSLVYSGGH